MPFRFVRSSRTLSSEVYQVWEGERRIGQADVHYADSTIHATIVLEADLAPQERQELLAQLDDDVVSSYMPVLARDDFIVVIFRGEEIESLSYPPPVEE